MAKQKINFAIANKEDVIPGFIYTAQLIVSPGRKNHLLGVGLFGDIVARVLPQNALFELPERVSPGSHWRLYVNSGVTKEGSWRYVDAVPLRPLKFDEVPKMTPLYAGDFESILQSVVNGREVQITNRTIRSDREYLKYHSIKNPVIFDEYFVAQRK